MKDETKSVILLVIGMGCFMFAAAFIILSTYVFGEQFDYKMTPELNEETKLLSTCINHNNVSADKCNLIYGGGEYSSVSTSDNCKLPGQNHKDNKPLSWKGKKLIDSGADLCTVSKKCDAMEVSISIKDKTELHKTQMYKGATAKQQKELDSYATTGRGHDKPNLICYEIQYVVQEKK